MSVRIGRSVIVSPNRRECETWCCGVVGVVLIVSALLWAGSLDASSEFERLAVDWDTKLTTDGSGAAAAAVRIRGPVVAHLQSNGFHQLAAKHDIDFGVRTRAPAVMLKRHVEYCQWEQHTVSHTDDNDVEHRRYVYVKGWYPYRIVSAFFDDPFSHHNPMHDPFPPHTVVANHSEMQYRHPVLGVDINVQPNLLDHVGVYDLWMPSTTADIEQLDRTPSTQHGNDFRYIGNGRFYAAYHEAPVHLMLRTAARLATGVLDVQLGDLFQQCTAGDIKVHFTQVHFPTMHGITVAASLEEEAEEEEDEGEGKGEAGKGVPPSNSPRYHLRAFRSSRGFEFSYATRGHASTETLRQELRSRRRWQTVGCICLALLGAFAVCFAFFITSKDHQE